MKKKKASVRVTHITLETFKESLSEGKYGTIVGARRAASRLSKTDKEAALKLASKKFGVGLDQPGTLGKRIKRGPKPTAVAAAPAAVEAPKKKRGRPRKNPLPAEAVVEVAAPVEALVEAPKRRGRPPKNRDAAAVQPVEKTKRARRTQSEPAAYTEQSIALDKIGMISRAVGTLDNALEILRKANELANGKLEIGGYQAIAETAETAIKALRPHVSALVQQDQPPPANGQHEERPYDRALFEAAAQSAGIPLPGDVFTDS